jgi:hypothetical protein
MTRALLLFPFGGGTAPTTAPAPTGTLKDELRKVLADRGEGLIYRPAGGSSREILALVKRQPRAAVIGVEQTRLPELEILAVNDSEDGISSEEVQPGRDAIDVELRIGDGAKRRTIGDVIAQCPHSIRVGIR